MRLHIGARNLSVDSQRFSDRQSNKNDGKPKERQIDINDDTPPFLSNRNCEAESRRRQIIAPRFVIDVQIVTRARDATDDDHPVRRPSSRPPFQFRVQTRITKLENRMTAFDEGQFLYMLQG